jgi:hypothetical protein
MQYCGLDDFALTADNWLDRKESNLPCDWPREHQRRMSTTIWKSASKTLMEICARNNQPHFIQSEVDEML